MNDYDRDTLGLEIQELVLECSAEPGHSLSRFRVDPIEQQARKLGLTDPEQIVAFRSTHDNLMQASQALGRPYTCADVCGMLDVLISPSGEAFRDALGQVSERVAGKPSAAKEA